MEVKYWNDKSGTHFKQIVSRKYELLRDLADEFLKRGAIRAELRVLNASENKWILLVTERPS